MWSLCLYDGAGSQIRKQCLPNVVQGSCRSTWEVHLQHSKRRSITKRLLRKWFPKFLIRIKFKYRIVVDTAFQGFWDSSSAEFQFHTHLGCRQRCLNSEGSIRIDDVPNVWEQQCGCCCFLRKLVLNFFHAARDGKLWSSISGRIRTQILSPGSRFSSHYGRDNVEVLMESKLAQWSMYVMHNHLLWKVNNERLIYKWSQIFD